MDFQLYGVAVLIGVAALYLLTVAIRGWRRVRQGKCSTSCGCGPKAKVEEVALIGANDLTLRLQQKRSEAATHTNSQR